MVVETTTVSVTKKVSCDEARQFVTLEGQAVIVEVLVDNIVEVVYSVFNLATVVVGRTTSRTGHTVVDRTSVSVVTKVLCDLAGQSLTSCAQAVTVEMRVEKIVEVLNRTVGVIIAEFKIDIVAPEEEETGEERVEEENTNDPLDETDVVLGEPDMALEAADVPPEDVNASELFATEDAVLELDTSGCVEERTLELAGRDGTIVDSDTNVLFVVAGTAIATGTEEVVFAYGATKELAMTELVVDELVMIVMTGTDVFKCSDGVMVESGRATELLV